MVHAGWTLSIAWMSMDPNIFYVLPNSTQHVNYLKINFAENANGQRLGMNSYSEMTILFWSHTLQTEGNTQLPQYHNIARIGIMPHFTNYFLLIIRPYIFDKTSIQTLCAVILLSEIRDCQIIKKKLTLFR